MSELRGTSGELLAGAEIRRLTELANQRALDPSRPVYNPMAKVDKSPVESVSPVEVARIDAVDAADAVESERAERPKWTLDSPVGDETARDVLKRYCGGELSEADAKGLADYIKDNRATKPMVSVVENEDPLVQKVYLDQLMGGGHHTERHEGWRDDLSQAERARMGFDPAQPTDSLEYYRSADALKPGKDKPHTSADSATRVHDPVAFAVAVANASEHPKVKAALEMPYKQGDRPDGIDDLRIDELLGPAGHEACSGFRLVGEDAYQARQAFVKAVRLEMPTDNSRDPYRDHLSAAEKVHKDQDLAVPEVEPIQSFAGGTFTIMFRPKADQSGYEIATFYPVAPSETPETGQEQS